MRRVLRRGFGQSEGDLDAVFAVKFSNNCADEVLDALFFQRHRLSNLLIRESLRDQGGNLILAVRKLETVSRHSRPSPASSHRLCDIGSQRLSLVEEGLSRLVPRYSCVESGRQRML